MAQHMGKSISIGDAQRCVYIDLNEMGEGGESGIVEEGGSVVPMVRGAYTDLQRGGVST